LSDPSAEEVGPQATGVERALREIRLAGAGGGLNPVAVADVVARCVRDALGSATAAVLRRDGESLAGAGYSGSTPRPQRLSADEESSCTEAVSTGRVARAAVRPVGPADECVDRGRRRSWQISVPVGVDGRVWGCKEAGVGYRVLSEPDPQLLVNVRWLAGFRERPPDPDGERSRMLSVLAVGSLTIGELMSDAREAMLARPVLMHLLWAGDALVDLSGPVGDETMVRARPRVAA
jgi:hypothetical protein